MTRAMPLWLLVGLQGVVSAASLVVEIVAGRMLAPHVGMSLYTWTAVIAVVLAGFSVGHWWGGRLAGKPPGVRAGLDGRCASGGGGDDIGGHLRPAGGRGPRPEQRGRSRLGHHGAHGIGVLPALLLRRASLPRCSPRSR
jgi:hypothetical protein